MTEPDEKSELGTDWDLKINDEHPTKNDSSKFEKFSFERSDTPLWMGAGPFGMLEGSWQIDGDLLRGTIEGDLLLGFPDLIGHLDNIGDWNLNFQDPCINVLNYEISSVAAQGAASVSQISHDDIGLPSRDFEPDSTTLFKISPEREGDSFIIIRADYTGWKRPIFANASSIEERCEDPTYPEKLELTINLSVHQPDGAVMDLPDACSNTPTFSEQTALTFSSSPTKSDQKIDAMNWTQFPSFEVAHSNMDLSNENVEVEAISTFSQMETGEIKIITEFGDETIIRVAPFSETESYKLVPLQRDHARAAFAPINLSEPISRKFTLFGFGTAEFSTDHCTVRTPTILESKTPEVCEMLVSREYFWIDGNQDGYYAERAIDFISEGECVVEATTFDGTVTQRFQMTTH